VVLAAAPGLELVHECGLPRMPELRPVREIARRDKSVNASTIPGYPRQIDDESWPGGALPEVAEILGADGDTVRATSFSSHACTSARLYCIPIAIMSVWCLI
jgi:hypothetical protein